MAGSTCTTTERGTCPHCGRPLPTYVIPAMFGSPERIVAKRCDCEAAVSEARERAVAERSAVLRRAWERTGVPAEYLDVDPDRGRLESLDLDAGMGMYIHGDRGTGKTTTACAILKAYVAGHTSEAGWCSARYVSAPRWLGRMRDRIGRWGDSVEDEYQRAAGVSFLVLDDIGKVDSRSREWATARLFDLVEDRCSNRRPTVFTSKYELGALADHLDTEDGGETSGDLVSRIYKRSVQERFEGCDMRLARKGG